MDDDVNLLRKTIMHKSFLNHILVIALMAAVLAVAIPIVTAADADEYHNPAIPGDDSPAYWLDRGALLATYGNYGAAIKAYKQALALDPNFSAVFFNLALAHFKNGELEQALAAINQALIIEPENGHYLYGRGWLLLQGYGADRADADFHRAAELGDQDALSYLQGRGDKFLSDR